MKAPLAPWAMPLTNRYWNINNYQISYLISHYTILLHLFMNNYYYLSKVNTRFYKTMNDD